jgi:hypothetical protein
MLIPKRLGPKRREIIDTLRINCSCLLKRREKKGRTPSPPLKLFQSFSSLRSLYFLLLGDKE